MIQHVHIITPLAKKLGRQYVISQLAECWEKVGVKVTTGPILNSDADIGILHVDSTWVAPSFISENISNVPILNSKLLDISKRRVSKRLVNRNSTYNGPVIVKTNANCFGKREYKALPFWSLKRVCQKLTKKISWKIARELPRNEYPVLKNKSEVPGWVWQRNDLIVEQFTPEMENGDYVLRVWLFFGDEDYVIKMVSKQPVVKASNIVRSEILDAVPESLRLRRAELEMDFGKFDYVMVNDEAILLDVNKTPTTASKGGPGENLIRVAGGLAYYKGDK